MKGKSIFKAGKLIKISLDYEDKINQIEITGDFFLYPEESIKKLENDLKGTKLNHDSLKARIEKSLLGSEVFGFSSDELSQAILQAVKQL